MNTALPGLESVAAEVAAPDDAGESMMELAPATEHRPRIVMPTAQYIAYCCDGAAPATLGAQRRAAANVAAMVRSARAAVTGRPGKDTPTMVYLVRNNEARMTHATISASPTQTLVTITEW